MRSDSHFAIQPRDNIDGATGGEADDDLDRARWIIIGRSDKR